MGQPELDPPAVRQNAAASAPAIVLAGLLLAALASSGCMQHDPAAPASLAAAANDTAPALTGGRGEPVGFEAPHFRVAALDMIRLGRNPVIAADPSGALLVTVLGCAKDATCHDGNVSDDALVYEGHDRGATWIRDNANGTLQLAQRPGSARSVQAHLASDDAGTRYVLDLVQAHKNTIPLVVQDTDGPPLAHLFRSAPGKPWAYVGALEGIAEGATPWRPWLAASGNGTLVATWARAAAPVHVSHDGGTTWIASPMPQSLTSGPPAIDASGQLIVVPAYGPAAGQSSEPDDGQRGVWIMRSQDGGGTWTMVGPIAQIQWPPLAASSPGSVRVIPIAGVTGDGLVVAAWGQIDFDASNTTMQGSSVWYATSLDAAATWSIPIRISQGPNAVMPSIVTGAGDRFAITYYATSTPGDPEHVPTGDWNMAIALVADGRTGSNAQVSTVEANVHHGSICLSPRCVASDSATLAELTSATLLPDGRIALAYPVDEHEALEEALRPTDTVGGSIVHVAIQDAGTPF